MIKFTTFKTLVIAVCMSCIVNAMAADFTVDGINYNINDDGVTVMYSNYSGELVIPETVTYNGTTYTVNAISDMAFSYHNALTSVTIPNTVKTMGYGAFFYCNQLRTVNIGNGLTFIGEEAFSECYVLALITCMAPNPPTMENSNCFTSTTYSTATLYVPANSYDAYSNTDYWNRFGHVIGVQTQSDPGDVNNDGVISISDVTMLIDYLLGITTNVNTGNADVDGNGDISISDVTSLIDMLLGNN